MNRRQRLAYTTRLTAKVARLQMRKKSKLAQKELFSGLAELGGIYIKFLQILALRSRFFTHLSQRERNAVFDAVTTEQINIFRVLERELGSNYVSVIQDVQSQPFASGSFGQVYFARHQSGMPLVIKVLRPSLAKNLKFDLNILQGLLGAVRLIQPKNNVMDLNAVFKDFRHMAVAETDYLAEVEAACYFYRRFHGHPDIVTPYIFKDLSTTQIIVQEYLGGIPLTDVLRMKSDGENVEEYVLTHLGSDLKEQIRSIGREMFFSILTADIIQGDPHPGNLKLLAENKVGIFDFGITAPPPDDRRAFLDMIRDYVAIHKGDFDAGRIFMSGLRFYVADLYKAINTISLASTDRGIDFNLKQEIEALANKSYDFNQKKGDLMVMLRSGRLLDFFQKTVNEGNRFALKVQFDGSAMIRAADTFMQIINTLGYRDELFPSVYEEVVSRVATGRHDIAGTSDIMDFDRALEIVSDWLQDLIERDPLMFRPLAAKLRAKVAKAEEA